MNDEQLSEFERRTRAALRNQAAGLDAATLARLAQARRAALSQHKQRDSWLQLRFLAPTGALAASVLVALIFLARPDLPGVNPTTTGALDDLELLADADAMELSQEQDLEFIEWAADMAQHPAVGG